MGRGRANVDMRQEKGTFGRNGLWLYGSECYLGEGERKMINNIADTKKKKKKRQ